MPTLKHPCKDPAHCEIEKMERALCNPFLDKLIAEPSRLGPGCSAIQEPIQVYTRSDKGKTVYFTTKDGGPKWQEVVRRVTYDLDKEEIIEDVSVEDQDPNYDWRAPLPPGVRNIRTQLYYKKIAAVARSVPRR